MTTGPAEVQIHVEGSDIYSMSFTTTLVPKSRLRCKPCGIRLELPMLQARAVMVAHNREFHPHVTAPNPDHVPLGKYEVVD